MQFILSQTLIVATPILLAGLGGILSERAGVINFALEGKMLVGAFAAAWGTYLTGDPWMGLLIAMGAGIAIASLHGIGSITLRGDQIISSFALNFCALGLTSALFKRVFLDREISSEISGRLPELAMGPLEKVLGKPSVLTLIAFALALCVACLLNGTRFGLKLRACGGDPAAAAAAGVSVGLMRWIAVLAAGALAAMGGAFILLAVVREFTQDMILGRGFIAVAAVILSRWRPDRLVAMSLSIGLVVASARYLQGGRLPEWLGTADVVVKMAPFLLVLFVAAAAREAARPPAGLGKWHDQ